MSNSINFGVSPYRTVLSLNRVNNLMSRNMERLSSGLRVNRAADDPAGLAVAIQMDHISPQIMQGNYEVFRYCRFTNSR